jgi:glycerol dehydrogenase
MNAVPTRDTKAFASPMRYYQGAGVTRTVLPSLVISLGSKPFLLGGPRALAALRRHGVATTLATRAIPYITCEFGQEQPWGRECCLEEIRRLGDDAQDAHCDVIVGAGGGKAVDTAKAVSHRLQCPVIIVPTIASTDAPTAAVAVLYRRDHRFEGYEFYARSPDTVVVDTAIIVEAPPRLLACGIGDAYSKSFEVAACYTGGYPNQIQKPVGGVAPLVSLQMASFLHTLLTMHSVSAMTDVRAQTLTPSVEAVVEGCVLISGLAFESGGLSAAHSLYNAFTQLAAHMQPPQYHGELVHFGTCVEVFLEAHPPARRREVFTFGHQVGLPETLEEIGLGDLSEETLWQVAEQATAPGETIHKARHPVTVNEVFQAIQAADDYGRKIVTTVPRTPYS